MKEISTKVVKLDIDLILKNFNKPEFWKKEWLIYKSDLIEIYAKLTSINLDNNTISMAVYTKKEWYKCKKLKKEVYIFSWWTRNTITIPIEHQDYSKEKFSHDLINSCLKIIGRIEKEMIEHYSEYDIAEHLERDYRNKLEDIANDFLDDHGVTNDEIREAYIDYYIDKCEIPKYTTEVISNFEYTIIPYEFLMMIAFFGDEEKYKEYSKLCSKIRKSTRIKLWLAGRKLDTDEFVEEMKDLLEDI